MAACGAEAGIWTAKPWKSDADLPNPAPDAVTQAIAFGMDKEQPAPSPFEITDRTSGENWMVLRYPEQTASVVVTRRPDLLADRDNVAGAGKVLLRGRIIPDRGQGGLSIELSGLEPGRKYHLVLFGVAVIAPEAAGRNLVSACGSDAPEVTEAIDKNGGGNRFFVYEYTAPSDGVFEISLENGEANEVSGVVRLCAFLNYRVE